MKSPRKSHTHLPVPVCPTGRPQAGLQFAQADTQPKIAKEYVLPTLKTGQKTKHIPPVECINH